jgi:hypothetical protein
MTFQSTLQNAPEGYALAFSRHSLEEKMSPPVGKAERFRTSGGGATAHL